jgi:putative endonuclease
MENQELGKLGEQYAAAHLLKTGYALLSQNWKMNRYEIDILAQIGNTVVVVEVKTRDTDFWGDPIDFVTKRQQKNLIEAADYYIREVYPVKNDPDVRFDVISVIIKDGVLKSLDHFEDAFYPTL